MRYNVVLIDRKSGNLIRSLGSYMDENKAKDHLNKVKKLYLKGPLVAYIRPEKSNITSKDDVNY